MDANPGEDGEEDDDADADGDTDDGDGVCFGEFIVPTIFVTEPEAVSEMQM